MRDPATHSRRSIRLPNFDYSDSAAYFVTLVTRDRAELFGRIADDVMHSSSIGEIVREEWLRSSDIRQELELAEFVVMPNHRMASSSSREIHSYIPGRSLRS